MTITALLVAICGWGGILMILGAYIMISTDRMTGKSPVYQWLNIVGAIGIAINSAASGAVPSVVLNTIWAGIALYTLLSNRRTR